MIQQFVDSYKRGITSRELIECFMYLTGLHFADVINLKWSDLADSIDLKYPHETKINWGNIYINFIVNHHFDKERYKWLLENAYDTKSETYSTVYTIQDKIKDLLIKVNGQEKSVCVFSKPRCMYLGLRQNEIGYSVLVEDKQHLLALLNQRTTILKKVNRIYMAATLGRVTKIAASKEGNHCVFKFENDISINNEAPNNNKKTGGSFVGRHQKISALFHQYKGELTSRQKNYLLELHDLTI